MVETSGPRGTSILQNPHGLGALEVVYRSLGMISHHPASDHPHRGQERKSAGIDIPLPGALRLRLRRVGSAILLPGNSCRIWSGVLLLRLTCRPRAGSSTRRARSRFFTLAAGGGQARSYWPSGKRNVNPECSRKSKKDLNNCPAVGWAPGCAKASE